MRHYHQEGSSKTLCGLSRLEVTRREAGSRMCRRNWDKDQLRPPARREGESERDYLRRMEAARSLFPTDDHDCPACALKFSPKSISPIPEVDG